MKFTKMQGLGNDFVFIDGYSKDGRSKNINYRKLAASLADRRFGVGADQILVLGTSKKADFRMDIYNSDGSQVEMCGNGLRCLAKYVSDHKLTKKSTIQVETLAGIQAAQILSRNRYCIDMGAPILKAKDIPVRLNGRVINRPVRVDGKEIRVTCVSMGNPHCVVFVEDLSTFPVAKMGPLLEKHTMFPKKANVEFVKVHSSSEIEMRVWERGAGETLACGSGACAVAVAASLNGFTDREVEVKLKGGILQIEWSRKDGHVLMTGPAETVFEGEIDL
ncbi:MAG: diaminopimelate epimerase [Deltaproteobacteria bacterium]|nr:diaminopimelate epimerase [Deltaproteobacteria bacterium]